MFVYIDESGQPRPNDKATRPVIVALCLRPEDVRHVIGAVYKFQKVLETSFGSLRKEEKEGKARHFVDRGNFLKEPKRMYCMALANLISHLDTAVFAVVMERPSKPIRKAEDRLSLPYVELLRRVDRWLRQKHPDRLATLVFDSQDAGKNRELDSCFSNFLFRSQAGQAMERIVPNILFVNSQLTPGIQLADFCAYVLRVYYEHSLDRTPALEDDYLATIAMYATVIRGKTFDYEDESGRKQYGIRTLSANYWEYESPEAAS